MSKFVRLLVVVCLFAAALAAPEDADALEFARTLLGLTDEAVA